MNGSQFGPVGEDAGILNRVGDAMTARIILDAVTSGDRFSVVEHVLAPRGLAAPLHMHSREDEYTVVLSGRVGLLLGDEVFYAGPGELVRKPRDQWHTFWNDGDHQARVLEIISPAGFEKYFEDTGPLFPEDGPPDLGRLAEAADRYGLQMDLASLPRLIQRFNLAPPPGLEGNLPG